MRHLARNVLLTPTLPLAPPHAHPVRMDRRRQQDPVHVPSLAERDNMLRTGSASLAPRARTPAPGLPYVVSVLKIPTPMPVLLPAKHAQRVKDVAGVHRLANASRKDVARANSNPFDHVLLARGTLMEPTVNTATRAPMVNLHPKAQLPAPAEVPIPLTDHAPNRSVLAAIVLDSRAALFSTDVVDSSVLISSIRWIHAVGVLIPRVTIWGPMVGIVRQLKALTR